MQKTAGAIRPRWRRIRSCALASAAPVRTPLFRVDSCAAPGLRSVVCDANVVADALRPSGVVTEEMAFVLKRREPTRITGDGGSGPGRMITRPISITQPLEPMAIGIASRCKSGIATRRFPPSFRP